MTLGEIIKEARLEAGMLQKQLAAEVGIRDETMNRIEKNREKPSELNLLKIKKALNLNECQLTSRNLNRSQ